MGTFGEVRFELALTLACAEDDELALLPVIDALKERGIGPEVVPGVDREPTLLGRAVDQGKPGLFLVCRSSLIDDSTFRRLEGLFSARRGPGQEIDAVTVDGSSRGVERTVDAILERVGAFSGQDVSTGEHEPQLERSEEHFRDVVELKGMAGVAAPGATRSRTPAPPEPEPRQRQSNEPTRRDGMRRSSGGQGRQPQRSKPPPEERPTKPASVPSKPAKEKQAVKAKPAKAKPAEPVEVTEASEEKEGREPKWLVPVVAVAALTFGALLLYRFVIAPGNDQPEQGQQAVAQDGKVPPKETTTAQPEQPTTQDAGNGGEAGEAEGGEAEWGGVKNGGPPPLPEEGGAESGGDETEEVKDERQRIEDAIEAGKMRALDLMIVLPKGPELSWRDAVDYCKMRRVSRVSGFRLPSAKELRSIRKARMLRTGDLYWTGTLDKQAGNGSDHVLALNKKNRMVATPKSEPNGRPVCVRER